MDIDAAWVARRSTVADQVAVEADSVQRLDELMHDWAATFGDRRADVISGACGHGSRGLGGDEATSFLRAMDAGQLIVDDAGYVVPLCVLPKRRPQRYACAARAAMA